MKATYRGFEISVTREKCLAGYDLLYFDIYRINDGYCLEESFSDESTPVREFMRYMKERVDAELQVNPGIADQDTEIDSDGAFWRCQKWFCEKCGKIGNVRYKPANGPMAVIDAIGDDHQMRSSRCDQPIERIRVVNNAA
jgi:hypothetical protein